MTVENDHNWKTEYTSDITYYITSIKQTIQLLFSRIKRKKRIMIVQPPIRWRYALSAQMAFEQKKKK